MGATVYYTKLVNGKLYPKAAKIGPYAYANEVSREHGKAVSRYIGIVKVSDDASVEEPSDVIENRARTNVVENGREADANDAREPE
ncbi:MAG: hypothetical protein JRM80_10450 [Nitrososphaerota archaeon]|nr:hypothetical protein [Nitrososphaerota archaeon]